MHTNKESWILDNRDITYEEKTYEKGLHLYFIKGVPSIKYGDNINLLDVNGTHQGN